MGGPSNGPVEGLKPRFSRLRLHAQEVGRGVGHAMASGSRVLGELVSLSPLGALLALAALGAWWYEHGQHLRQAGELHQLKKQTAGDIAQLQSEAEAATKEANQQRAQQIVELELGRQRSERDAAALRQRLLALQGEEQTKAGQVAALPTSEVASQLATRLGLGSEDVAPSGSGLTGPAAGASLTSLPAGAGPFPQVVGSAPPATPDTGRSQASAPVAVGQARPPAPPGTHYFQISETAMRKMSSALVSLDSCTEQAQLKDELISNCQDQGTASAAVIDQQKASIAKLNEALNAKDQILAKSEAEHRAELKVVRGTFSSRIVHTLEHVAIGVAVGLVLRR